MLVLVLVLVRDLGLDLDHGHDLDLVVVYDRGSNIALWIRGLVKVCDVERGSGISLDWGIGTFLGDVKIGAKE